METTSTSILGLIDVYNLLPQSVVDTEDVHSFEAKLQGMMRGLAKKKTPNWEILSSPWHALHLHPLAKSLNGVVTIATIPVQDDNGGMDITVVGAPQTTEIDKPPSWWGGKK